MAAARLGPHAGSYGYADGVERVLEQHDGSVTYYVGSDFEVRDGIAVTYARVSDRRITRTGKSTLQTGVLEDLATGSAADARIDVGDAWLVNALGKEPMRHLYASARRRLLDEGQHSMFLHQDHLGNTTLATGATGAPLGERAFGSNGGVSEIHGYVDEYGFTGQRRDPSTNLVHFTFREFDPRVGRWNSPDPRFLTDRALCVARPFECPNGYLYVTNNPVDRIDPTGEMERSAVGTAAAENPNSVDLVMVGPADENSQEEQWAFALRRSDGSWSVFARNRKNEDPSVLGLRTGRFGAIALLATMPLGAGGDDARRTPRILERYHLTGAQREDLDGLMTTFQHTYVNSNDDEGLRVPSRAFLSEAMDEVEVYIVEKQLEPRSTTKVRSGGTARPL
ncbi:MAG: RHS repeat-associated core domain-containing protein [Myxococcales bacterium]